MQNVLHFPVRLALLLTVLVLCGVPTTAAPGAESGQIAWGGPLADPVIDADAVFFARKTSAWTQGSSRWLLLDGDVRFKMGAYTLVGTQMVVRIDSQVLPGQTVRHVAIYLADAQSASRRSLVTASAPRLLVTASTTGRIELETDLLDHLEAAPDVALVADAAARIARYHTAMAHTLRDAPSGALIDPATLEERAARQQQILQHRQTTTIPLTDDAGQPISQAQPTRRNPADAVLPVDGVVDISADRMVIQLGDEEHMFMLMGNAHVFYQGGPQQRRGMTLKAHRIVVFVAADDSGTVGGGQLDAKSVRGVYLEDNVITTDGEFTVRAPRMYYDLEKNKALLLEAVMFTFDVRQQIPLYLRADVMRQTSATSFNADRALFTTSEFGQPHFAIAARHVTVNRVARADGSEVEQFVAYHTTPKYGTLPLGYWPVLAGENRDVPIRSARVGYRSDEGPIVLTRWDLFSIAGRTRPEGVDLDGLLDWRGEHGAATGANLEYQLPDMFGSFDSYLLPADSGDDQLGNDRNDVTHDSEIRGYAHFVHRHQLRYGLDLSLEGSYVSDETFLEEFFRDEADTARESETSLYLTKQEDDWALTLLGKTTLNDFTPQLAILQTPGYTVDKVPELGVFVTGRSLWDDRLTWFGQTRLSRMRIRTGDDTPATRGFNTAASAAVFGTAPTVGFDAAAKLAGIPRNFVSRADTRQELSAALIIGPVNVNPYVAGRITAYDQNFAAFAGETEQVRFWGQAGLRAAMQFHRIYDQVESRVLNLNRLRHIIEPTLHGYSTGTSINAASLPVFDPDVEAINKGSGLAIGVTNTLQTQRGGPQRWRSVDWIRLTNRYVLSTDEETPGAAIPRFFDYRPDFSVGGDHFYSQLLWMVSDSLAVAGEITYATDLDSIAQWHLGMTMNHGRHLQSYLNYHQINALGTRLLSYGFTYQLTTKYKVALGQRLDFSANESRQISLSLERRLPRWTLRMVVGFDEVNERQSVALVLIPHGVGGDSGGPVFLR